MADSILLDQTSTINESGDLVTALNNDDSFILSLQNGETKTVDFIELVKEIGRAAGLNVNDVNLAPLVNGTIPSQYVSHGGGSGTTFHVASGVMPGNTSGAVGDLWLSNTNWDLYRLTAVTGTAPSITYTWEKQGNIRGTGAAGLTKANVRCGIIGRLEQGQYQVSHRRIESTDNRSINGENTDGVVLEVGDRVIYLKSNESGVLTSQSTESSNHKYNGIYIVSQVGSRSAPYILTRSEDFDSDEDIQPGSSVYISEGTHLGGTKWVLAGYEDIELDGTGDNANIQFKRVRVVSAQFGNPDWNSTCGHTFIDNKPDIPGIVADHSLNARLNNAYAFPTTGVGKLQKADSTQSHIYQFGRQSFSVSVVARFGNNVPSGHEDVLFNTMRPYLGNWNEGIRIVRKSDDKIHCYLNSTTSNPIGSIFQTGGSASEVAGKMLLITLSVDRVNSRARIYFNETLELEQSIPSSLTRLDGGDVLIGGVQGIDGATLRDTDIFSLVIWDKALTLPEIEKLARNKNVPDVWDAFTNPNVYTSDFSSGANGWTSIASNLSNHSATISGQAVHYLRLRVSGIHSTYHGMHTADIMNLDHTYELSLNVGRFSGGTSSNNKANGLLIIAGSVTNQGGDVLYQTVMDIRNLPTEITGGWKNYKTRFRVGTGNYQGGVNDPNAELRIYLTNNGNPIFSDSAGDDSFDIGEIVLKEIGAVESFESQYINHRAWIGDYDPRNQLLNTGCRLSNDSVNDEGSFLPEFQIGNDFYNPQMRYTFQKGSYRREGNLLHFDLACNLSSIPTEAKTGVGRLGQCKVLLNIPFKNRSGVYKPVIVTTSFVGSGVAGKPIFGAMAENSNEISLEYQDDNGVKQQLNGTHVTDTISIHASGVMQL